MSVEIEKTVKKQTLLKQAGQGLSEYIIIVALIAVAAIGVVGFFGGTISNQIAAMAKEMAGEDGVNQIDEARKAAADAAENSESRGLGNYNEGNKNRTGG